MVSNIISLFVGVVMKSKFIPIIFFPLFLGSCGSKEYPNSNFEVVATGKTKEYLVETA
jgi:hypothetical protein